MTTIFKVKRRWTPAAVMSQSVGDTSITVDHGDVFGNGHIVFKRDIWEQHTDLTKVKAKMKAPCPWLNWDMILSTLPQKYDKKFEFKPTKEVPKYNGSKISIVIDGSTDAAFNAGYYWLACKCGLRIFRAKYPKAKYKESNVYYNTWALVNADGELVGAIVECKKED